MFDFFIGFFDQVDRIKTDINSKEAVLDCDIIVLPYGFIAMKSIFVVICLIF